MTGASKNTPLNTIRAYYLIAREGSVTKAARILGITQSAASRHLAVMEAYLGAKLVERKGRRLEVTSFGRLFADAVGEPLEAIDFAVQRMRRGETKDGRIVVRTSLSTFAYTTMIPNLRAFSDDFPGTTVDLLTSLDAPARTDDLDVLVTRDISLPEPSDHWDILEEQLVCVGTKKLVAKGDLSILEKAPVLAVTSRPDILPRWLEGLGLRPSDIIVGARYDHHYLALPAAITGQALVVAPEIIVAEMARQNLLTILPGSRVPSGMTYRAYAVDRSKNPDLSRAFCRWLTRLCRSTLSVSDHEP